MKAFKLQYLVIGACATLLGAASGPVDSPPESSSRGSVAISGPDFVSVGQTIELIAQGTPAGGTYRWFVEPDGNPSPTSGRARLLSSRVRTRAVGKHLWVTGLAASDRLADIQVSVTYADGGMTSEDTVHLTCVDGELTAYRPQHGNAYFPHTRTAVEDAVEEDLQLGPGIRINADTDPISEDDLIEVAVDVEPAGASFALVRGNPTLSVWTTRDKQIGTDLVFSGNVSLLGFGAGQTSQTLWVEWASAGHGNRKLELGSVDTGVLADKLLFHSFKAIVMALGGEDQVPSVPVDTNHGTFLVGIDLYRIGYDVHLYDEDNVSNTGTGAVYDEIVNAIQNRLVEEAAFFGFSHGGGSTYHLAERLDIDRAGIGTFTIPFTSYIDGVRNNSDMDTAMELRYPPTSGQHVNHHQVGTFADFFIDGGPVPGSKPAPNGLNVETTGWGSGATHFTVDDFDEVQDLMETCLIPLVKR